MAKTRTQKEQTVTNLSEKVSKAKLLAFADYRGLNMKQLSELRQKLAEVNAEFTITKNTLLSRSLPPSTFHLPPSNLEGPTATLFAYGDEVSPLKALVKTLKDAGMGKIKAGFLSAKVGPASGWDFLDEAGLNQMALLPTKDELRAKTVGVLVAPLQGMVGVLQANLRNLVYALDQIKLQKGGV